MVLPADIAKAPIQSEPDLRLRRHQRLRSNEDFQEAYAQGKSWPARTMVLWLRKAPDASLRLGVVSSRAVGKAVQRNRARRRLREVWRLNRHRFHGNVDVILVARRNILSAKWKDVTLDLLWLARRAGILT
jgi:ribonuclease P protein component